MNQIFLYLLFLVIFLYSCTSFKVVKEPLLERTVTISEPVCFSFFSLCRVGSFNSVIIKGVVGNVEGNKKYFLEYYLKDFEIEFPIGISLKIDDSYYNLPKSSTEYSENVSVGSELNIEILDKILNSKKILLSYSSRKETTNIEFSSSEHKKLLKNIQKVKESLFSAEKLIIVK